jgi:hypothetical protein
MPQRRSRTGLERRQIDAELIETDRVTQALASAADDDTIERRWVICAAIEG